MDVSTDRILGLLPSKTGQAIGAALAAIVIAGGGFWAGRATAPVPAMRHAVVADTADDETYSDDTPSTTPTVPTSDGNATPVTEHRTRGHRTDAGAAVIAAATKATGTKYVHRNNSDLRQAPSYAAETLKKEPKGAQVEMVALSDKWAEVKDGSVKGWMRASVLKDTPPDAPGARHPRKKKTDDDAGDDTGTGD
jgi:hypothetical protein